MALTKTPIELSSTPGIVDNSNATAITIDASENVGIGVSNPSDYYTTNLVVGAGSEGGITIASSATSYNNYIAFADSTSGLARYAGLISYEHSTDNMVFRTNSLERVRIDSAGLVGIGTSNPDTTLHLQTPSGTKSEINFAQTSVTNYRIGVPASTDALVVTYGASTERLRITSAGRMVVNGTVAGYSGTDITVGNPSQAASGLSILSSTTGAGYLLFGDATGDSSAGYSGQVNYAHSTNRMGFNTDNVERLAIDSSGRLLVNTASILSGSSAKLQVLQNVTDEWSTRLNNSSASPFGLTVGYSATPNNTANYFLYMSDGTAGRFQVASNGNVGSANSSYGGMSDLKLKENIVDAGSQWDDLKAVRVRKYSFKEENSSEPTQIGVIAQEVEAAGMAGLVYESPDQIKADDGSIEGTGEVTKNMKYSILYMKAIKALQEAMERIETLEAKVQTLENN